MLFSRAKNILTEQKFLFDGNKTRLLEKTFKSRDYNSLDGFGGTADYIRIEDDRIIVADYKTGKEKDPCCAQMKVLAGFCFEVWNLPVTTVIVNIPVSKFPARNRAAWYSHKIKHELYTHVYSYEESASCAAFMRDIYSRVTEQRQRAKNNLPLRLIRDDTKQCEYCNSKKFCEKWSENASISN